MALVNNEWRPNIFENDEGGFSANIMMTTQEVDEQYKLLMKKGAFNNNQTIDSLNIDQNLDLFTGNVMQRRKKTHKAASAGVYKKIQTSTR